VIQPAHLALVLQGLHLSKILMARKASRIFREACHYIFRLNLSELSIDWNGVNIASNLFPIFGCPLTLVGMSASRSIKMRQMKILTESGRVRIESLIVKWHLYGARNRLKKLGDLVKSTSLRSLDLSGYEDTYIAYTINMQLIYHLLISTYTNILHTLAAHRCAPTASPSLPSRFTTNILL